MESWTVITRALLTLNDEINSSSSFFFWKTRFFLLYKTKHCATFSAQMLLWKEIRGDKNCFVIASRAVTADVTKVFLLVWQTGWWRKKKSRCCRSMERRICCQNSCTERYLVKFLRPVRGHNMVKVWFCEFMIWRRWKS